MPIKGLRKALSEMAEKGRWKTLLFGFSSVPDNAGMIAISGYCKYLKGEFAPLDLPAVARWEVVYQL